MSRNLKISAVLVAIFVAVVSVIAATAGGDDGSSPPEAAASPTPTPSQDAAPAARVVASDARRLGRPGRDGVTFTEFLDFECEACGAAYPAIEQLRRDYAGRVTFQLRYFPIDSHANARNAAHAVEAAAQQGKLEAMYSGMYETQFEWGEQQDSKAKVFRGYAKDLGLDMTAYDRAVAAEDTAARVQRDVQAGLSLGVQSTPTFFIGEERIDPESFEDLRSKLDAALRGA